MKHSIFVKFIAVTLCALFLLTSVASGLSILAFTTTDLYEKTVDEVYYEAITDLGNAFAGQLVTQYASQTLGGCPEEMLRYTNFRNIFAEGCYAYILYDPEGKVVAQQQFEKNHSSDITTRFLRFEITGREYMKLVSTGPLVESYPIEPMTYSPLVVTDNIPYDGVPVRAIEVFYLASGFSQGYTGTAGAIGELYTHGDGSVSFRAYENHHFISEEGNVAGIIFYGMDGTTLYKAVEPSHGVGTIYTGAGGYVYFDAYPLDELSPTVEPSVTEAPAEEPTEMPTEMPISQQVTDNLERLGMQVATITVFDETGYTSGIHRETPFGYLIPNPDGTVTFRSYEAMEIPDHMAPVCRIAFLNTEGRLLYEAQSSEGVGEFTRDENGFLLFTTTVAATETTRNGASAASAEVPDATEAPAEETPTHITDNLDQLGVYVATITIFDEKNYTVSIQRDAAFGYLSRNDDGTVTFRSNKGISLPENVDTDALNHIAFLDVQGRLLYEVQSPKGVGRFFQDEQDRLVFISTVTPAYAEASNAPAEVSTEAPTEETASTVPHDVIASVTEPNPEAAGENIFTEQYWDNELQSYVAATYVYEDLPEGYTLELWLLPGAYELDPIYDLLTFVWGYRAQLFYILGISVLLFAVFAVYLCCAAGRKPGRAEVHAEGLNRLSLDVYLVGGGLIIYTLVLLCLEGGYYLLRNSPHVLAPLVLIAGYLAALIIVGFSFACAAQLKTPAGYWWRNTLIARFFRCLISMGSRLEQFLGKKCFPFLGRCIHYGWKNGIKLCKALYRYTEKFLTWLVGFTARSIKVLWKYLCLFSIAGFHGFEKTLHWLGKGLGKIAQRTHAWLHAFLSLLPVTWQWLIIGLILLFLLAISLMTRSEGFFVFSILAGMALVVYGSHCFGVLWDSTKRMSKGDLETKADDKLMVGCFRDFADDLNALADVAVVAAQKQLKSERMKTELITNVSHDIKTPLTSIINYVDLLQKPHTDEEQEMYLEVLSRQSLQMKKLLEDLIDMSKASTGNMAVYPTRLNAAETISQALGEFSDKLDAARLIPVLRQPEADVHMLADGRLVWRVLSNILSNVVKYALPGTRVYIDLAREADKVLISVKNISREELNINADELMERFVRGDTSRNTEGSGLGLNIAQSLMEIQKGRLEILVDGDLFKVTLTFPGCDL